MKQAMIFAAGLGTRLKPLTDTMPKALVRVGGVPLLEHVILRLKGAGFERIVVNVHHFARQIIDYIEENNRFGLDIRVSDETDGLLETGGGIRKAMPLFEPDSPVLIHNVDILSNVDLADFYRQAQDSDATLLVSDRKTKRYLLFDDEMSLNGWTNIETGEIRSPYEELKNLRIEDVKSLRIEGLKESHLSPFAFSGIHVICPSLFPLMAPFPDKFGIMNFYLKVCAEVPVKGILKRDLRLMDVGKLDTLEQAEQFLLQESSSLITSNS